MSLACKGRNSFEIIWPVDEEHLKSVNCFPSTRIIYAPKKVGRHVKLFSEHAGFCWGRVSLLCSS